MGTKFCNTHTNSFVQFTPTPSSYTATMRRMREKGSFLLMLYVCKMHQQSQDHFWGLLQKIRPWTQIVICIIPWDCC